MIEIKIVVTPGVGGEVHWGYKELSGMMDIFTSYLGQCLWVYTFIKTYETIKLLSVYLLFVNYNSIKITISHHGAYIFMWIQINTEIF